MITRFDYPLRLKILAPFSNSPPSILSSFHPNMPSKLKTSRREHSKETIAIILALHASSLSHGEIAQQVRIPKSTVTKIIHRVTKTSKTPQSKSKKRGRPPKLDARARRELVRHVEKYPQDNLNSLTTLSKSGQQLSKTTGPPYANILKSLAIFVSGHEESLF